MPANAFNGQTDYGIGLGLRVPHYGHILEQKPDVAWFEIISETFMVDGGRPLEVLDAIDRPRVRIAHIADAVLVAVLLRRIRIARAVVAGVGEAVVVLVVVGLGGAPAQVAVRALDVEDLVAGADDEQPPRAHASL